jgi:hypothetical protein
MTPHQQKTWLWVLNVGLALAVVAAAAAVVMPLDPAARERPAPPPAPRQERPAPDRVEPLSAFAGIYARDLRPPLFDAPTPQPTTSVAVPRLTVRLTGTIVEQGHGCGVFRTATGQSKVIAIGETIEGAELVSVEDGLATLRHRGTLVTIKAEPRQTQTPAPARPPGKTP